MAQGSRCQARRSQQVKPQIALQLRQEALQTAPPHGERLLSPKGLRTHRIPLRQARKKLPRLRLPRCRYRMVDLMSLGPSTFAIHATRHFINVGPPVACAAEHRRV